jgi:hypothetical protein
LNKKVKKILTALFIVVSILALLISMQGPRIFSPQHSQERKDVSTQTKPLSGKEQDKVVEDLKTMVQDGYRPTEVEKKLKQSIGSLDDKHSTRAVREFMNAIKNTSEYFGQLLDTLGGEIQYSQAVDGVKDPVKDMKKLSNKLAKGYLAEMNRQHLLVKYVDSSFYIDPDAQYVLDHYGKYVTGDYKDYINLLAKEQSDPIFDDKSGIYNIDRLAEDLLYIENARDRWEKGEFAQDWSDLERSLYEIFFASSHATFFNEKIEHKGTDKETYTYTLKPEIRKKYEEIMLSNKGTDLAKDIEGLLNILDKTHNVVNDKVDKYISDLIKKRFDNTSGDETTGKAENGK